MSASLRVIHADNQILIFLHRTLIYTKSTDYDPMFEDVVDFTSLLITGINGLILVGLNHGGPYNFEVQVDVEGVTTRYGTGGPQAPPPPGFGVVWSESIVIPWP